jgi:hypothetical protein
MSRRTLHLGHRSGAGDAELALDAARVAECLLQLPQKV